MNFFATKNNSLWSYNNFSKKNFYRNKFFTVRVFSMYSLNAIL